MGPDPPCSLYLLYSFWSHGSRFTLFLFVILYVCATRWPTTPPRCNYMSTPFRAALPFPTHATEPPIISELEAEVGDPEPETVIETISKLHRKDDQRSEQAEALLCREWWCLQVHQSTALAAIITMLEAPYVHAKPREHSLNVSQIYVMAGNSKQIMSWDGRGIARDQRHVGNRATAEMC